MADAVQAFRQLIGPCDMLSYLVMMAPRLMECRRFLKPSGSMYLHCDTTASHYLKLLCDAVFLVSSFKAEISWKRHNTRSTADNWPHVHDMILYYTKTEAFTFNPTKVKGDERSSRTHLLPAPTGASIRPMSLRVPD